ncbi:MAG: hypothetical protein AAGC74_07335 [Verrucomicrobiota bacterium]
MFEAILTRRGWNRELAEDAAEFIVQTVEERCEGDIEALMDVIEVVAQKVKDESFARWVRRPSRLLAHSSPFDKFTEGDYEALHGYFLQQDVQP